MSARSSPRAYSSQSGRYGAKPASREPRSASSLGNPRKVKGGQSSSLEPLATSRNESAAELQRANTALREELLYLNRQLDDALASRGQRMNMRTAQLPPKRGGDNPADKLQAKNEAQRKANAELRQRIREMLELDRVTEVTNELGSKNAATRELRSEVRGLENVYAHQKQQLAVIEKHEAAMRELRAAADADVAEVKEQVRGVKEQRDAENAAFDRARKQTKKLDEKLKLQVELGDQVRTVEDMQERVEEKDKQLDALKYQVAVLSKTNTGDKKKAKVLNERVARELASLREEAGVLRQRVAALGLAAELGVDVRV